MRQKKRNNFKRQKNIKNNKKDEETSAAITQELQFTIKTLEKELQARRNATTTQMEDFKALSIENEAHKQDILHLHSQIRMFAIKNKKLENDLSETKDDVHTSQDKLYEEINELKLEKWKLSKRFSIELHESEVKAKEALEEKEVALTRLNNFIKVWKTRQIL